MEKKRQPMFNGLAGKPHRDMVGLLMEGRSCEEVSGWLDVNLDYVKEQAALLGDVPPAKKTTSKKG